YPTMIFCVMLIPSISICQLRLAYSPFISLFFNTIKNYNMSNNKMYGVSVMVGALLGTMPMEGLAIEDESEKAGTVTELPVIEVQGSTRRGPDELPSMYTGGQQARGARVG